jgi:2-polyprenyl-6-methoxyphenol hydroxylase-like FAD-dependent oxidoreductase
MTSLETLPIAAIGAGPIGLAAAAHLIQRGLPVKVYEAGATVAANVRDWGHVRLFSPWEYNTDSAARALLQSHGWQEPPATPEMASVIETNAKVTTSPLARPAVAKLQGLSHPSGKGR